jgi:F-type H+-transporting ATPase subunit gamma
MPNLKDLKVRINSVKSTRKITSAMKMVAAAKLRRAQEQAEAARPYSVRMERMIGSLAGAMGDATGGPKLLVGTGKEDVHLLLVMTADRGLCGAFNSSVVREARRRIQALTREGKQVKVMCIGRKGRDQLRRDYRDMILDSWEGLTRGEVSFAKVNEIATRVIGMFEGGEFDVCEVVYNRFQSAMTQIVTRQRLIPANVPETGDGEGGSNALYEYEPDEEQILAALLPRNVATQMFTALLESNASEHGARMTAMDNATRNAGDMIDNLTLVYNRTRQAYITKELIEIISGAEAL